MFHRGLLTRYLAETGENSSLTGVIAISAMWDGVESMSGLERFPNRQLYSRPLSRNIRERAKMLVVSDEKEACNCYLFIATSQKF